MADAGGVLESPRGHWIWVPALRHWVATPSMLVAEAASEPVEPKPPPPGWRRVEPLDPL